MATAVSRMGPKLHSTISIDTFTPGRNKDTTDNGFKGVLKSSNWSNWKSPTIIRTTDDWILSWRCQFTTVEWVPSQGQGTPAHYRQWDQQDNLRTHETCSETNEAISSISTGSPTSADWSNQHSRWQGTRHSAQHWSGGYTLGYCQRLKQYWKTSDSIQSRSLQSCSQISLRAWCNLQRTR